MTVEFSIEFETPLTNYRTVLRPRSRLRRGSKETSHTMTL